MRKKDCILNATQILALANTNSKDRAYILRIMKERTEIGQISPTKGIHWKASWVNFQHGRILCKHLKLEQKLKPLIEYGLKIQHDNGSNTEEQIHDYITEVWRRPTSKHQCIDACHLEIPSFLHDRRTSSTGHGPKV